MRTHLLLVTVTGLLFPGMARSEDPSDNRFTGRLIGWAYLNEDDREPALGGRAASDFSGVGLGLEWENMSLPHLGIAVGISGTSNVEHRWIRHSARERGRPAHLDVQTTMDLVTLDVGARFHTAENFDELDFFAGGGVSVYMANIRAESPGYGSRGRTATWYEFEDQGAGVHLDIGLLIPISYHFAVGLTERIAGGELDDTGIDVSNSRFSLDLSLKF